MTEIAGDETAFAALTERHRRASSEILTEQNRCLERSQKRGPAGVVVWYTTSDYNASSVGSQAVLDSDEPTNARASGG